MSCKSGLLTDPGMHDGYHSDESVYLQGACHSMAAGRLCPTSCEHRCFVKLCWACRAYNDLMRRKLGLLADLDLEEQDQELVEGLLKTMHETGGTVGCLLSDSMHDRLCSSWNIWHLMARRQRCGPSKHLLGQRTCRLCPKLVFADVLTLRAVPSARDAHHLSNKSTQLQLAGGSVMQSLLACWRRG